MKRKVFFSILALIFCVCSFGQSESGFDFENYLITDNVEGPCSVFAADIDGDGDPDVVTASYLDNKVSWWENDGSDDNWPEHIITTNALEACSAVAGDVDHDGDIDVVASSILDDTIAWWENDGSGNFTEHVVTETADGVSPVILAKINSDEHLDIVAAYYGADTVTWWENNGSGSFTQDHEITTLAESVRSVVAADLDGDDDLDVLSASVDDGKIAWYENTDGEGNFGPQQIIYVDPVGAWRVSAGDINGDSHIDVVASVNNSTLLWFQNDGQVPPTFSQNTVSENSVAEWTIPFDIDSDGDNDIIVAEWAPINEVRYFDNVDGLGQAWTAVTIDDETGTAANCLALADIDNDGDKDIFSSWEISGIIAWHENPFPLGIHDNALSNFVVYPSPTTGVLHIESKTAIVEIQIYDQLGQMVLSNLDQDHIDMTSLSQGLYFVRVFDENANTSSKKVIKQ